MFNTAYAHAFERRLVRTYHLWRCIVFFATSLVWPFHVSSVFIYSLPSFCGSRPLGWQCGCETILSLVVLDVGNGSETSPIPTQWRRTVSVLTVFRGGFSRASTAKFWCFRIGHTEKLNTTELDVWWHLLLLILWIYYTREIPKIICIFS